MPNETYDVIVPESDQTEPKDSQSFPYAQHRSFLEKVMAQGELENLYDARDIAEVVFRTMRDMMTNEAVDRIADDLHSPLDEESDDKTLYTATPLATEVEDLWQDTNPVVHFLSRVRPVLKIRDTTFLFRIKQEASLPATVEPEQVIKAVFAATKDELSADRIQEITEFLPGTVAQLWRDA